VFWKYILYRKGHFILSNCSISIYFLIRIFLVEFSCAYKTNVIPRWCEFHVILKDMLCAVPVSVCLLACLPVRPFFCLCVCVPVCLVAGSEDRLHKRTIVAIVFNKHTLHSRQCYSLRVVLTTSHSKEPYSLCYKLSWLLETGHIL
jgi:hypothetical protein